MPFVPVLVKGHATSSDTGMYIVVPPENCTAVRFAARRSVFMFNGFKTG